MSLYKYKPIKSTVEKLRTSVLEGNKGANRLWLHPWRFADLLFCSSRNTDIWFSWNSDKKS